MWRSSKYSKTFNKKNSSSSSSIDKLLDDAVQNKKERELIKPKELVPSTIKMNKEVTVVATFPEWKPKQNYNSSDVSKSAPQLPNKESNLFKTTEIEKAANTGSEGKNILRFEKKLRRPCI